MKLGIIELHHKDLHGSDEDSIPNIATHFMVYNAFGYPGGVSVFEKLNKEIQHYLKNNIRHLGEDLPYHILL